MSGHSKWSTIKRKKAIEDSKRGKAFTKLIKEISVCARTGGGDPAGNPRLRLLLDKSKAINMPQENAIRAIKRGTSDTTGANYEHIMYEGYGPHNVAVVIEALTDNKNRTVAEIRRLFSSHSASLGETGTVSWMFERKGVVRAENQKMKEDDLLEHLLEYDVDEITYDDGFFSIFCDPKSIEPIKETLIKLGFKIESADLEWVAKNTVNLSDTDNENVYKFLTELEDHDDVQNVFSNLV
jgi:YebC/PmpR family DNA-binding regulatory protein